MSVIAIAKVTAADGEALEALAMIKQGQVKALNSDVCEKFDILQNVENPHCFSLFEVWHSIEGHKAFLQMLMKTRDFTEGMKCVAEGPYIEYFDLR